MRITLQVNGQRQAVVVDDDTPLLYVLTNELQLKGPRFGCGLGQCGSCSVLVDGAEIKSCVVPAAALQGKAITTLEGLPALHAKRTGIAVNPGKPPALHPVQQAFIDVQAPQCGYCYNGMVMKAAELLSLNPNPSEQQIRSGMNGQLCRCGTYQRIVQGVQRAAVAMRSPAAKA